MTAPAIEISRVLTRADRKSFPATPRSVRSVKRFLHVLQVGFS